VALLPVPALASDFDWHSRSDQQKMHAAFANTAKICAGGFGFTLIPALPERTMADKLDAYLLLRDDPEGDVATWATSVVAPANAILAKSSDEATEADDHQAAAAAVAAAEDPAVYAQAEERYLQGAMGPIKRALAACSVGARDPFLGKYYWTGSGSADDFEKSFKDWFSEFVADLKEKTSKASRP
jgi:hypothetical protein